MSAVAHEHDHEHDDHHHEESFVTKYIFSLDHKMIAKQFLISGLIWAFIGGGLSILFRIQLGFPDANLSWLEPLLGNWIVDGKMDPNFYLAAVTMLSLIHI